MTLIKPTRAQQRAISFAKNNWDGEMPLLISGAAGTGKTSIVQHLTNELNFEPAYMTPTGKAAQVLRGKIGRTPYVSTIHSALYAPSVKDPERYDEIINELKDTHEPHKIKKLHRELKKVGSPVWILQPNFRWQRKRDDDVDTDIDSIVVDEASMIGGKIGNELVETAKRHGLPIILAGDFYQLPPVNDIAYFSDPETHVAAPEIDEIVRQAEGSAILELATNVRDGFRPRRVELDGLSVFPRDDVDLWEYDIILCGLNRTRHRINEDKREEQKHTGKLPQPGEPMILLRNDNTLGICNGDIFKVIEAKKENGELWITGEFDSIGELTFMAAIEVPGKALDMRGPAHPIAFAYAITTHKAQGSEWSKVLVIDESKPFGEDAFCWLYTAVTRAKEHLTLIKRY